MHSRTSNTQEPILARVGLVADTHVGEILPELPPGVALALAGCELILHAGDITDLAVLDELGKVAPVVAVQGDHDREGGIDLPRERVVEIAGKRIGLTHGDRSEVIQRFAMVQTLLAGELRLAGFHRAMVRRFRDVDCVVHGHLHLPLTAMVNGVLVVSPGAVHVPERDPKYRESRRGSLYLRVRERVGPDVSRPSVGILEIRQHGLHMRRAAIETPGRAVGSES
jgi:putative phosphoesterase